MVISHVRLMKKKQRSRFGLILVFVYGFVTIMHGTPELHRILS